MTGISCVRAMKGHGSSGVDSVLTLLFTSGIVIDTAAAASNSYRMIYRGAACARSKVT